MFKKYLYSCRRPIFFFIICTAFFTLSFILFRIPARAVIYPSLICAVFGIPMFIFGYFRKKRLHTDLEMIKKLPAAEIGGLPLAEYPEAEDYNEIISGLCDQIRLVENIYSKKEREAVDYYTVWVHQIKTQRAVRSVELQRKIVVGADRNFARFNGAARAAG